MRCIANIYRGTEQNPDYYFYGSSACGSANALITVSNSTGSEQVASIGVTDTNSLYAYDLANKIKPSGGIYNVTIENQENYVGTTFLAMKSLLIDYVSLNITTCACSAVGACCDGCNTLPGRTCGTQDCPPASYYQSSGTCHKLTYPATCTKTCGSAGACQDCTCTASDTTVSWPACGTCQQTDYSSSCQGSTGPSCKVSVGASCGTGPCPSDSYYQSGGICYKNDYPATCTKTCGSAGACQDCTCTASSIQQPWPACGTCQQIDYSSCQGSAQPSCKASTGASCTTASGLSGTCSSSGQCMATPVLSRSVDLQPNPVRVTLDQAVLSGTVSCSNADCGIVYVYPKSSKSGETPINNVPGLRVSCGTINCEYACGNMTAGRSCNPKWSITGTSTGTYPLFLRIISDNPSLSTQTDSVYLYVNEIPAGTLSASLKAEPETVTAGSVAKVTATISCSGAVGQDYCGNITSYLFYNGNMMTGSGSLFTASSNPSSSCRDMWGGGMCDVVWQVNATSTGTYSLSVIADSDYHTGTYNVNNATVQAQLTVNERPVGVLSFENLYVTPASQSIILGGTARLGASVRCSTSATGNLAAVSCGTVKAYPTYDGMKINQSGSLTVITTERDCGSMNSSGSVCPVYWNITGKALGSYSLAINANSSSSETRNITSQGMMLEVTKNLGVLSIPSAGMSPDKMNLTSPPSTARLSAMINCSTPDCGKANVTLWLDAQMLDSGTAVSTQQNTQACNSFPCNLNWTLAGNSAGTYDVGINVKSNETQIPEASKLVTLTVTDPKRPQLSVSSDLKTMNVRLGQPVQIKANVTCLVKDCGLVAISLGHSSGGWKELPYGSVYLASQDQNPVYATLPAGQYVESSWSVNFTQTGMYKLRVAAAGSAANITNDERQADITVSDMVGNIRIMSPEPNREFLRGDPVFLKANVMGDGKPMTGLAPMVEEMVAMLYDDGLHNDGAKDDGVYAGNGRVPTTASGRYALTFSAGSFENQTYIYVTPALYVTASADKDSYSWGEAMVISGEVRTKEGGENAASNVTLVLTHGKDSKWRYEKALSAPAGYFSYNYSNQDTPNVNGVLMIVASARDDYANSGQDSVNVSIKAAEGVYKIAFLMDRYNYRRGDNMSIAARPMLGEGIAGGVKEVKCTLSGSVAKTLAERAGTYYGIYTIPASIELGNRTLSCSFAGAESGTGYTDITIEPMRLNISVISPYDPAYKFVPVTSTEPVELTVAVFYPDDTPVIDASVEITAGGRKINMTATGVPGIYSASGVIFWKERSGAAMSSMLLEAQDLNGNLGSNEVNVVVDSGEFNWWWLLLIPVGMAILFIAWYYEKSREPPKIQIQEKIIRLPGERVREVQRVREIVYRPVAMPQRKADPLARLREEVARLEERQKTITNAKDLAEQQYYKRQIDEATFNKLMQSYEEKLIEIDAAVRQKRKELSEMRAG